MTGFRFPVSGFRLWLAVLALTLSVQAEPVKSNHVEAELVCEARVIKPGEPFWIGIALRPEPGWHTYWLNPGDSGMGLMMEWLLPDGFTVGPLLWPSPERIVEGELTSFGYRGDTLLLAQVTPAATVSGSCFLGGRARWLACNEVCLSGTADLTAEVRTGPESDLDLARAELFARARTRLPAQPEGWQLHATYTDERYVLSFYPATPLGHPLEDVYFYPLSPELIVHHRPQLLSWTEGAARLLVPRSDYQKEVPARLEGVLYSATGWDPEGRVKNLSINVPVEKIYK